MASCGAVAGLQVKLGPGTIVPPSEVDAVTDCAGEELSVTLIWNAAVWAVAKVPVILALTVALEVVIEPRPAGTVPVVVHV